MSQFALIKKEGFNSISLPNALSEAVAETLKTSYKQWLLDPDNIFVFDFTGVTSISNKTYIHLIGFSRELKTNNKRLFSINLASDLFKQIKNDGLENILNPCKNIDEVKSKVSSPVGIKRVQSNINVEFINPFILAAMETIKVQANTPLEPGKPFAKTDAHNPSIAICGVINISSDQFKGSISLLFPKEVFLKIYENMVGEKHTEISADIQDACGELLNIIFGQAKAKLNNEKGFNIQKALPTVMSGNQIKVQQTTGNLIVVLPFRAATGEFYLEITAESN